jgi:predicted  nucleic acid-binding Zn-ribbon protein
MVFAVGPEPPNEGVRPMPAYSTMAPDQLNKALEEVETRLADARTEREFLGRQQGAHINASEFAQLDREMERYERQIGEIREAIAAKAG